MNDSHYVREVSTTRIMGQKIGFRFWAVGKRFSFLTLILTALITISQASKLENGTETQPLKPMGIDENNKGEGTSGAGFSTDWNTPVENSTGESVGSAEMNLNETANEGENGYDVLGSKNARLVKKNPASPRKSQFNRRLGLSARTDAHLNPKEFEERGKELHGQFYEIGGVGKTGEGLPVSAPKSIGADLNTELHPWVLWVGAAGLAGASAGIVGYMLMGSAHPSSPPPKELVLTD